MDAKVSVSGEIAFFVVVIVVANGNGYFLLLVGGIVLAPAHQVAHRLQGKFGQQTSTRQIRLTISAPSAWNTYHVGIAWEQLDSRQRPAAFSAVLCVVRRNEPELRSRDHLPHSRCGPLLCRHRKVETWAAGPCFPALLQLFHRRRNHCLHHQNLWCKNVNQKAHERLHKSWVLTVHQQWIIFNCWDHKLVLLPNGEI